MGEPVATQNPGLRTANIEDLDAMWAIERSVFQGEAWSLELMREELLGPHRTYLALEDGRGELLGYGGVLALGEEGDIQTIALVPKARGRGLGRTLLNGLLDEARRRRVSQVFLEVRADKLAARTLYTSTGFQEIAVRPKYYQPDNVDAVVMRLLMENRR